MPPDVLDLTSKFMRWFSAPQQGARKCLTMRTL